MPLFPLIPTRLTSLSPSQCVVSAMYPLKRWLEFSLEFPSAKTITSISAGEAAPDQISKGVIVILPKTKTKTRKQKTITHATDPDTVIREEAELSTVPFHQKIYYQRGPLGHRDSEHAALSVWCGWPKAANLTPDDLHSQAASVNVVKNNAF